MGKNFLKNTLTITVFILCLISFVVFLFKLNNLTENFDWVIIGILAVIVILFLLRFDKFSTPYGSAESKNKQIPQDKPKLASSYPEGGIKK